MDYWPRLKLTLHDDADAFFRAAGEGDGGRRCWYFTTKAARGIWETHFSAGDWLVFGSETHGLSDDVLARHADRLVRIPQTPGERCLNLSTAAGVGLYEALRQISAAQRCSTHPSKRDD
jgi:tRNA (cytidine/uridine-2'-O-)-methyltransferase